MAEKAGKNRRKTTNLAQANEILESISDGFYALDRDWRFIYVNKRAASNLGLEPQDIIGQNIWEKFPQIIGPEHEIHYRKAMQEGKSQEFEIQGVPH